LDLFISVFESVLPVREAKMGKDEVLVNYYKLRGNLVFRQGTAEAGTPKDEQDAVVGQAP